MVQDWRRKRQHVIDRRRIAAVDQGTGAAGEHQGLAGAWTRPPGNKAARTVRRLLRAPGTDQLEDSVHDALADRDAPYKSLRRLQFGGGYSGPCPLVTYASRCQ